MREFNSINDWHVINTEIRCALHNLHDFRAKRQLAKMLDNLQPTIVELSQAEIEVRRTSCSTASSNLYLEKLAKCRQQLQELQQWLMFATLIDTKPEI